MKQKIIIYGCGDFAQQMYWYFSHDSVYEVVGFCVDSQFMVTHKIKGLSVYSFENIEKKFPPSEYKMFVAVGYSKMRNRQQMFQKAKNKGYEFINYISSQAQLAIGTVLGCNNVILSNVVVEPNVCIQDNNIVWSNATICHDVVIGNHNFFAAGVVIGGFTQVQNLCFVGFNSTVIQNLKILDESLIGAHSLQLRNTSQYSQWYGNPSNLIKYHMEKGIEIK